MNFASSQDLMACNHSLYVVLDAFLDVHKRNRGSRFLTLPERLCFSSSLMPFSHPSCVTARHSRTQELVDRTRAHPSYAKNFSFNMDSSWVEAHPCGDGCDALPQVVALDCEMSVSEVRPPSLTSLFFVNDLFRIGDILRSFLGGGLM